MNPPSISLASHPLPAILWAGLICGAMDIMAAFITWWPQGVAPARLLKGIAGGLLGPRAYNQGWPVAVLGLACHFFIAYSAATVFYLASRKLSFLTLQPVLSGILYGVSVYVVMYWIVVPLSRLHRRPHSLNATIIAIITHMICVGLPISLTIRRFSR
jgi:hypothetical protein